MKRKKACEPEVEAVTRQMEAVPGDGGTPTGGQDHTQASGTASHPGVVPGRPRRPAAGRRHKHSGPAPDPVWDGLEVERSPLRSIVLVGGAAVTALVLTTGGFLLLNGDEAPAEPPPLDAVAPTSPAAVPAPAAPASPASEVQINARNPFAARVALTPMPTTSEQAQTGAGGGGAVVRVRDTTTVTTEVTITGPGETVTARPTAVTATTTITDKAVWLTLISLADPPTDEEAVMIVNGKKYTKEAGDSFGAKKRFTYMGTEQQDTGEWCGVIAYVDEEFTVCEGEQIQVH